MQTPMSHTATFSMNIQISRKTFDSASTFRGSGGTPVLNVLAVDEPADSWRFDVSDEAAYLDLRGPHSERHQGT